MNVIGTCTVEGCSNPRRLKLYCEKHYQRWRKYRDVTFISRAERGEPQRYLAEVVIPYQGDDCLKWPYSQNGNGYGRINHGGRKLAFVHRLVCEAVRGPAPSSEHVAAHSCGNGNNGCCAPRHLRWATQAENVTDMELHGTKQYGEKTSMSKLTEAQVLEIKRLKGKVGPRQVAKMFGVERHAIQNINRGKTWGWLNP